MNQSDVKHAALIFRRYKISSAMQGKTIQIYLQNPEEEVSRNRGWQSSAATMYLSERTNIRKQRACKEISK